MGSAPAGRAQTTDLAAPEPQVQVTLTPGAAAEGDLRFGYDGTGPLTARATALEVHASPEGARFGPPGESGLPSAAGWITFRESELTLQPGQPATLHYRVQVPVSTPPGDYAAFILLAADDAGPSAGVRLAVSVPGDAQARPVLEQFSVQRQTLPLLERWVPSSLPLVAGGPIEFQVVLRNEGSARLGAAGEIELFDLAGAAVARLPLAADAVFPGDGVALRASWPSPPLAGLFRARLSLEAGGQQLVAEDRVVVLPWAQLLAGLAFALLVWLLLGRRFALPLRRPTGATRPVQAVQARGAAGGVLSGAPTVRSVADAQELVREGKRVARAGDRATAYRLFVRALETDPRNEEAWLWRAGTSTDLAEALACLERVLEINPDNLRAQRGRMELRQRCGAWKAG